MNEQILAAQAAGDPDLGDTYYEHWLAALEILSEERDLPGMAPISETVEADAIDVIVATGGPSEREVDRPARFAVGDRVRARNLNPSGHTRLPRYVRGCVGEVALVHGNHVLPDTAAHLEGENPQQLYCVRFSAQELWGPQSSARDATYVDLWEDYLEAAA